MLRIEQVFCFGVFGMKKEHIFIDGIEYKECSRCKEILTLDMFHKDKSKWDNLHGFCKCCTKKVNHETYIKNPQKKMQKVMEYQKLTGLYSRYHPYNPKYYSSEESKRKKTERDKRRRTLVKNANKKCRITKDVINQVIQKYNGCCAYCGKSVINDFEIDHKIPLFRGGGNEINNLALSCKKCNSSKGKRTYDEYVALR